MKYQNNYYIDMCEPIDEQYSGLELIQTMISYDHSHILIEKVLDKLDTKVNRLKDKFKKCTSGLRRFIRKGHHEESTRPELLLPSNSTATPSPKCFFSRGTDAYTRREYVLNTIN